MELVVEQELDEDLQITEFSSPDIFVIALNGREIYDGPQPIVFLAWFSECLHLALLRCAVVLQRLDNQRNNFALLLAVQRRLLQVV